MRLNHTKMFLSRQVTEQWGPKKGYKWGEFFTLFIQETVKYPKYQRNSKNLKRQINQLKTTKF